MSCQPEQFFIFTDTLLRGKANVYSATSQAGAQVPVVVAGEDNFGAGIPLIAGIPDDTSVAPRVMTATSSRGYTYDDEGASGIPIGADDPRRMSKFFGPFSDDDWSDTVVHGDMAAMSGEYVVVAAAAPNTEIRIRRRLASGAYDSWTDITIDLDALGAPLLDDIPGASSIEHATGLLEAPNGDLLCAYQYTAKETSTNTLYGIAVLKSEDNGSNWVLIAKDIVAEGRGLLMRALDGFRWAVSGNTIHLVYRTTLGTGSLDFVNVRSYDNGLTWTDAVASELNDEGAAYDLVGLTGGTVLLALAASGSDGWQLAAAGNDGAFDMLNDGSAFAQRRNTDDGVRAIACCRTRERVWVMVSVLDGTASADNTQLHLYYHRVDDILQSRVGVLDAADLVESEWVAVTPWTGLQGRAREPWHPCMIWTGYELWIYGAAYDTTQSEHVQTESVGFAIGGESRMSWGVANEGEQLGTIASGEGRFNPYDVPLYSLSWDTTTQIPDGGGVGETDTYTGWTATSVNSPTVAWDSQGLRLTTTSAGSDEIYYEATVSSSTSDSWVLEGSSAGLIGVVNSSARNSFLRVTSQYDATDVVDFEIRMNATSVQVYDHVAAANVGSGIVIDTTGAFEARVAFYDDGGTIRGMLFVVRLDDYLATPQTDTFTLSTGTDTVQDRVRFGLDSADDEDMVFREVWVAKGVGQAEYERETGDQLSFYPASTRKRIGNGQVLYWAAANLVAGDTYTVTYRYQHGAGEVCDPNPSTEWRSAGDTPTEAQTLIFVADPNDDSKTFAGDHLYFAGVEDFRFVVDFDNDPAFGSAAASTSVNVPKLTSTNAAITSVDGDTLTFDTAAGSVFDRNIRPSDLIGKRLTFATGTESGNFYEIVEANDDGRLRLGGLSDTLDNLGVTTSDTFNVYGTSGWVELDTEIAGYRYMRVRFTDTVESATGDKRLAVLRLGYRVDVPFEIEWTHNDAEEPRVSEFETAAGYRWAYEQGPVDRVWTGRILNDYTRWRDIMRVMLRELSHYQVHPIVFVRDAVDDESAIYGTWLGGTELQNAFWWDQNDGEGAYRYPGGDLALQIRELR